ncbi:methylthioribulose 1-phosphate dehydratase [Aureliella helgolandensis]|uniref:Methylthioribulose-1-phosphate dehydratase n=1 Tax=Aureliella helgolandensis TaxID=2527968 RepID=A0A518GFM9_9BACT|nr:methylthioribulose 1-phosphate dehydratase [Aureliella helgolandensis]QDV27402.1 Methylthioribulose-1-phosphate dehydratase [Aureliella helgolandensis]
MSISTESDFPAHLQPYAEQIDGLREVGRVFWERGWSVGTSSNYSVVVDRNPTKILVTASGKHKGRLSRADFVLVDSHGEPIQAEQPKSSAETLLHCVAAEDSSVGAILHTHSVWSTVLSDRFSAQGGILLEGYEMLKGLSGVTTHEHAEWLPIFENTQHIPDLAAKVKAAMQSPEQPLTHGYIIRKHGIYTWGQDLDEAFRQIEILEFLLECVARTGALS